MTESTHKHKTKFMLKIIPELLSEIDKPVTVKELLSIMQVCDKPYHNWRKTVCRYELANYLKILRNYGVVGYTPRPKPRGKETGGKWFLVSK